MEGTEKDKGIAGAEFTLLNNKSGVFSSFISIHLKSLFVMSVYAFQVENPIYAIQSNFWWKWHVTEFSKLFG